MQLTSVSGPGCSPMSLALSISFESSEKLAKIAVAFHDFKEESSKAFLAISEENASLSKQLVLVSAKEKESSLAHEEKIEALQRQILSLRGDLESKSKDLDASQLALSNNQISLNSARQEIDIQNARAAQVHAVYEAATLAFNNRIGGLETGLIEKERDLEESRNEHLRFRNALNAAEGQIAGLNAAIQNTTILHQGEVRAFQSRVQVLDEQLDSKGRILEATQQALETTKQAFDTTKQAFDTIERCRVEILSELTAKDNLLVLTQNSLTATQTKAAIYCKALEGIRNGINQLTVRRGITRASLIQTCRNQLGSAGK